MNKLILVAAALLLTLLWMPTASAVCSVGNSSLTFGSFSPLTGITVDATGTITVNCFLQLVPYTLTLSPGNGGSYTPRRMASGGNTMEYNLYSDAAHTKIWGDGTGTTVKEEGTNLIGNSNHTVYGQIPLSTQRTVMVGSYSDSITITVIF